MLSLKYQEIYSVFLSKADAYDLAEMADKEAHATMGEWLRAVKSNIRFRQMFSTLLIDDERMVVQFEIKYSQGDDETDLDFVRDLMGVGMAFKWVEPKYKSIMHTRQFFGGKEEKFFSQSNFANSVKNLYEVCKLDFINTIRDYDYMFNGYITGDE